MAFKGLERDFPMAVENLKSIREILKEARDASQLVLDHHWDRVIPVDSVKIARSLGLSVFSAQLGIDTLGMVIGSGNSADIYINDSLPPVRYRFSCAHELGHYVYCGGYLPPETGYVDRRSESGEINLGDIYANEFASSILMPEKYFRESLDRGSSTIEVAARFQVPLDTARKRYQYLNSSVDMKFPHFPNY